MWQGRWCHQIFSNGYTHPRTRWSRYKGIFSGIHIFFRPNIGHVGAVLDAELLPLLWSGRDLLETLWVALRASGLTMPGQDRDQHCLMWEQRDYPWEMGGRG